MKRYGLLFALAGCLSLAACSEDNRQPQPQPQQIAEYTAAPVNPRTDRCEGEDDYEYDTDCGYTEEQHELRMAYLATIGYIAADTFDTDHRRRTAARPVNTTRPATTTNRSSTTVNRTQAAPARTATAPAPAPTSQRGGFGSTARSSSPTTSALRTSTPAPAPRPTTTTTTRSSTTRR